jgi:hypothetical protein
MPHRNAVSYVPEIGFISEIFVNISILKLAISLKQMFCKPPSQSPNFMRPMQTDPQSVVAYATLDWFRNKSLTTETENLVQDIGIWTSPCSDFTFL